VKNCPQIERINVRNNLLTNLEFLSLLDLRKLKLVDVGLNKILE
ncbi:2312_t:CDS:1, partial [Racocetra fulgida]